MSEINEDNNNVYIRGNGDRFIEADIIDNINNTDINLPIAEAKLKESILKRVLDRFIKNWKDYKSVFLGVFYHFIVFQE